MVTQHKKISVVAREIPTGKPKAKPASKAELKRRAMQRVQKAVFELELAGWMDAPRKVKDKYTRAFNYAHDKLTNAEFNRALNAGRKAARGE